MSNKLRGFRCIEHVDAIIHVGMTSSLTLYLEDLVSAEMPEWSKLLSLSWPKSSKKTVASKEDRNRNHSSSHLTLCHRRKIRAEQGVEMSGLWGTCSDWDSAPSVLITAVLRGTLPRNVQTNVSVYLCVFHIKKKETQRYLYWNPTSIFSPMRNSNETFSLLAF